MYPCLIYFFYSWNHIRHNIKSGHNFCLSDLKQGLYVLILCLQVDYFVDCHSTEEGEGLWVIGGTNAGTLGYFPVRYKGGAAIGSPEAVLGGGHSDVVRSVLPMSGMAGTSPKTRGIFGWTGGEDGRLCCWLSDDSPTTSPSWMSSSLVLRSSRSHHKKNRHHPY